MGFRTSQHQLFDAIAGHRIEQAQDALAHGAEWHLNMDGRPQDTFEHDKLWRYTAAQKAFKSACGHGHRTILDLIQEPDLVRDTLLTMTQPDKIIELVGQHDGGGTLSFVLEHWPHTQDWKDWTDTAGHSLLMRLVMTGKPQKTLGLLSVDASTLENRDTKGKTALFHCLDAAQLGVLLLAGADVYARDHFNRTPLEVAVDRIHSLLGKGSGVAATEWDKLAALCGTRHLIEHPDRATLALRIESLLDRAFNRTVQVVERVVPQVQACAAERKSQALLDIAQAGQEELSSPKRKM